jgi:hypothetical protein
MKIHHHASGYKAYNDIFMDYGEVHPIRLVVFLPLFIALWPLWIFNRIRDQRSLSPEDKEAKLLAQETKRVYRLLYNASVCVDHIVITPENTQVGINLSKSLFPCGVAGMEFDKLSDIKVISSAVQREVTVYDPFPYHDYIWLIMSKVGNQ